MAILPVEILAPASGFDWAGRAAAPLASRQLIGDPKTVAFFARDRGDALRRQATRLLHAYASREPSGWKLHGVIEDAATHRNVSEIEVMATGPADLGPALASAIWPGAPKKTWNPKAVEAYGEAIVRPAAEAVPLLRQATGLESGFEDAWLLLAQMEAAVSGRDAALATLGHAPATPAVKLLSATLRGNADEQFAAMEAVTQASPADWEAWAQLGSTATQLRRFPRAAEAYANAIARSGESGNLLNQAAYAFELAGQHAKAMETLDAYARLAPDSANPLDSRGEVLTMAGKFDDAAKAFRDAEAKDPSFLNGALLLKAAEVKRYGGDNAAADKIFEEWEKSHGNHPALWMHRAIWDYTSGRRAAAEAALAKNGTPIASLQLMLWKLDQGDRATAEALFAKAAPSNPNLAALGRALLTGETPSALLQGVSRMLRKDFGGAVAPLEAAERVGRPDQASITPILLAWAYVESGQLEKAKPLLAFWPIPRAGGDPFLESLAWPRLLELRKRAGL